MNAHAARSFLPTLREVERSLRVPLPERTRILRELESDLEQLEAELVGQGVAPAEARRRAVESLVPKEGVLEQLGRIHRSSYRRATSHIDDSMLQLLERGVLTLVTAAVLAAQTAALVQADLLRNPSPFLWPVLGLGGGMFSLIVWKAFELWIKGDHERPATGLNGILGLCVVLVAAGAGGTTLDLYRLAATLEARPELSEPLVLEWLVRDAALLAVSFLMALAGALMWLVLTQWVSRVSGAHRAVLGLDEHANLKRRHQK